MKLQEKYVGKYIKNVDIVIHLAGKADGDYKTLRAALPDGVTVARWTLNPLVLVRIQVRELSTSRFARQNFRRASVRHYTVGGQWKPAEAAVAGAGSLEDES